MISPEYQRLNAQHAAEYQMWGSGGIRHAQTVRDIITKYGYRSVLDFGCGRATLGNIIMGRDKQHAPMDVDWFDYDPAHADKQKLPRPVDLVVSTHVLEHVEPELLDATLDQLKKLALRGCYIAVPHKLARHVLPDGRNAHLTTQPATWWKKKLAHLGRVEQLPQSKRSDGLPFDESRYLVLNY